MKLALFTVLLNALIFASPTYAETPTKKTVSILFVGDVVLDGAPGKAIEKGVDPFDGVASIFKQADIRIANLECVVATHGIAAAKNFTFRAEPRILPVLKKYVDAVSLANNHSGDFGHDAFSQMLGLLEKEGVAYFGGGRDATSAHKPHIIEKNGLRIALLGYNEFMPRSFEANTKTPGIAWSENEQVVADIKNARQIYRADIVIPFMHWGWEDEVMANARQRALARKMIDAGADAVVGGHPHVVQDTEHYRGKPIIYSLGNFMIDSLNNEGHTKGWALRLHIDKKGVQAWDTQLAKLNDDGIPSSKPELSTPCWDRKSGVTTMCKNKDLK